jgi:ABC-type branched-subunit amino acid transport system ATPase component
MTFPPPPELPAPSVAARSKTAARAAIGVHGDKDIPRWADATTDRIRKRVVALQAINAAEAAPLIAFLCLVPQIALQTGHRQRVIVAMLVMSTMVTAICGLPLVSQVVNRARTKVAVTVALNAAVLATLAGLLPKLWIFGLLLFLRGVALAFAVPVLRPFVHDAVVPEARARAFARFRMGTMFGAMLGAFCALLAVWGPKLGPATALALAGVIALVMALVSFRLTDPGIGGVEPVRLERALGEHVVPPVIFRPWRETLARILAIPTARHAFTSYVAIGWIGAFTIVPFARMVHLKTATWPEIDFALATVFATMLWTISSAARGMEKNRRESAKSLAKVTRAGFVIACTGLGQLALLPYVIGHGKPIPGMMPAIFALLMMGGSLAWISLDVTALTVLEPADRPTMAAASCVSIATGGALGILVFAMTGIKTYNDLRIGFGVAFVVVLFAAIATGRVTKHADEDLDKRLGEEFAEMVLEDVAPAAPFTAAPFPPEQFTPEPLAYVPPPPPVEYVPQPDYAPPAYPAPVAVAAAVGYPPPPPAPPAFVEQVAQRLDIQDGVVPVAAINSVNFSYGSVQVLFDVSMFVRPGEMVALLGPNGVGKTTLLRVLAGLERPQQGEVRFEGRDITGVSPARRVGLGLSQIVGGQAVFGSMTVEDNLRMYGFSIARDRKTVEAGIKAAYEVFPRLGDRRSQLGSTLSGGEQQMLALSKALMLKPKILAIDEFSLGLAPVIVGELLTMVRRLNAEGTSVLVVEQSVNVALNLVDRCYFMEKGHIVHEGRAEDLRGNPELVRALSLGGTPHAGASA